MYSQVSANCVINTRLLFDLALHVLTHVFCSPAQVLKSLRTAEFRPYVVFVRPQVPSSHCRRPGSTSSLSTGVTVGGGTRGGTTQSWGILKH